MEKDQVIRIRVSKDEMEWIQQEAGKKRISVCDYAREVIFGETNDLIKELYSELLKEIETMPCNTEFVVNTVLWRQWADIPYNVKISFGRLISNQVKCGKIEGVISINKKRANAQVYKKIK